MTCYVYVLGKSSFRQTSRDKIICTLLKHYRIPTILVIVIVPFTPIQHTSCFAIAAHSHVLLFCYYRHVAIKEITLDPNKKNRTKDAVLKEARYCLIKQ